MEIVRKRSYVWVVVVVVVAAAMMRPGNSDINKDKEECAGPLAGLATCLPYVGGKAKAPTSDCCTGLKQVVKDNMKCLCILIKDRDDPSLGLHINLTLALTLPHTCQGSANISQCPGLLHLAPNDPATKVFTDFAKASANTTAPASSVAVAGSGSSSGGGSSNVKSDGGGNNGKSIAIFIAVLLPCFALSHHLIF